MDIDFDFEAELKKLDAKIKEAEEKQAEMSEEH